MKATEQYFPVLLFILYKVILSFESVGCVEEIKCVTIQMKAIKSYFPVVLFIYYAVQGALTFESVDEILV